MINSYEFRQLMYDIIEETTGDLEQFHKQADYLMEETLIELGYEEGVEAMREQVRWYS